MNIDCQEDDFSMESLLLRYNKQLVFKGYTRNVLSNQLLK